MSAHETPTVLVEVAEFRTDSRYRLVHFRGTGWEPLAPEEFEPRALQLFPELDPARPDPGALGGPPVGVARLAPRRGLTSDHPFR
ncbi:hypothetical protein GCM10020229_06970 [Kitasatospora albolonga]|uniref:hypothetical protein n=1 Tax=Kitasatospora albolonga TaxID=68173 RepID=UPI0031EEBAF1